MGNSQYRDEDIINYIREGWSFRVKTVKGRGYITRRKGQTERGMGPFESHLWRRIAALVGEHRPGKVEPRIPLGELVERRVEAGTGTDSVENLVEERMELSRRIDERISQNRGAVMMMSCLHNRDGWCTYWNWDEKPAFFEMVDELYGENAGLYERRELLTGGQAAKKWVLRASLWYCSKCSAHISQENIAMIHAALEA